ncbi:MAG: hypothetical protein WD490_09375 [Opitutales bacterium]
MKEILRENLECEHLRETGWVGGTHAKAPSSLPGFSSVLRWGLALLFMGYSLWILNRGTLGIELIPVLLLSVLLFAVGMALIASNIIDWTLNLLEPLLQSPPPPPADWDHAQALLSEGKTERAIHEVENMLYHHPHDLRGYIIGLQAAARRGNQKKIRRLRALAKKNLGAHDRNLLEGTIKRLKL